MKITRDDGAFIFLYDDNGEFIRNYPKSVAVLHAGSYLSTATNDLNKARERFDRAVKMYNTVAVYMKEHHP